MERITDHWVGFVERPILGLMSISAILYKVQTQKISGSGFMPDPDSYDWKDLDNLT